MKKKSPYAKKLPFRYSDAYYSWRSAVKSYGPGSGPARDAAKAHDEAVARRFPQNASEFRFNRRRAARRASYAEA